LADKLADQNQASKLDALLGKDKAKPWYLRYSTWIGVALIVIAIASFWRWQKQKAASQVPVFHTQIVRLGDVTLSVIANGTLQPIRTYAIGSELSGTVSRVNVDVNDTVRQGEILIELDTSKLRDQILRTKANLSAAAGAVLQAQATEGQAKLALGRLQAVWQLSKGQIPSRLELDTARADVTRATAASAIARSNVKDAQAALSTDEINLSKAFVRAPADGVVLTRTVEPGSAVAASFQAVTLLTLASDLKKLRVWGYVDEADVGVVKPGQEATFTVSAFIGRKFPAFVTRVGSGSTITDNVVTYLTYLDVENTDLMLRPGMTATATIIATQHKNVLVVPNTALRFTPSDPSKAATKKPGGILSAMSPRAGTDGATKSAAQTGSTAGAKVIYVLRDSKPVAIPITPGISDGQMTEILPGALKAGMAVITDQRTQLKP